MTIGLCVDVGRAAARVRGASVDAVRVAQPLVGRAPRPRPAALLPAVLHRLPRAHRPRLFLLQDAARCAQVRTTAFVISAVYSYKLSRVLFRLVRHFKHQLLLSNLFFSTTSLGTRRCCPSRY